mmetsp:Transcript_31357/g.73923  ORF Transcript_31357/g.73923 Transcript_31357/m.73923 type:complete len:206 (+) Transcript_31357:751-1368(+)
MSDPSRRLVGDGGGLAVGEGHVDAHLVLDGVAALGVGEHSAACDGALPLLRAVHGVVLGQPERLAPPPRTAPAEEARVRVARVCRHDHLAVRIPLIRGVHHDRARARRPKVTVVPAPVSSLVERHLLAPVLCQTPHHFPVHRAPPYRTCVYPRHPVEVVAVHGAAARDPLACLCLCADANLLDQNLVGLDEGVMEEVVRLAQAER